MPICNTSVAAQYGGGKPIPKNDVNKRQSDETGQEQARRRRARPRQRLSSHRIREFSRVFLHRSLVQISFSSLSRLQWPASLYHQAHKKLRDGGFRTFIEGGPRLGRQCNDCLARKFLESRQASCPNFARPSADLKLISRPVRSSSVFRCSPESSLYASAFITMKIVVGISGQSGGDVFRDFNQLEDQKGIGTHQGAVHHTGLMDV